MRLRVFQLGFLALLLGSTSARADWPMARHDARRTGATGGTSNLVKPVPYWRTYLGGTIAGFGLRSFDIDGDGKAEVVHITGGKLVAKTLEDVVVWSTPPLGLLGIAAIEDVDGDKQPDVIAYATDRAYVFSAKTGATEWAETDGEMGTLGGIRVGDLDGDGKADVFVQECGCCGVSSGKTGFAYSFSAGFASPKLLFTLPSVACGGRNNMAIFDGDGDGAAEVTLGTDTNIQVLSGKTGALVATSPNLGELVSYATCVPANVDGVTGEELVCYNNYLAAKPTARRMFVLKLDKSTSTPNLSILWQRDIGDIDGEAFLGLGSVVDLDGDGKIEIVANGKQTDGKLVTYVLDATTGTELAKVSDRRLLGVARLEANPVILTQSGATTHAYKFDRTSASLTLRWSLANHLPVSQPDPALVPRTSLSRQFVLTDVTGDKVLDLVMTKGTPADALEVISGADGTAKVAGSFSFSSGTTASNAWVVPGDASAFRTVLVAKSDGFLLALDSTFKPTNAKDGGLRFGGYYANGFWRNLQSAPVVASFDGGAAQSIVVANSAGAMVRFDVKGASLAVPPAPVWSRPYTTAPAIVPGLDGTKSGIACRATVLPIEEPPKYEVVALHADGTTIWQSPLDGVPFGDVVPGKVDTGGKVGLVAQWGLATDALTRTRAFSGTGTKLWDSAGVDDTFGRQPAGFALFDWNGDGRDDVILQAAGTRVLSGADGTQLAIGGTPDAYFMPTIYDVDGDGTPEITLHGGFSAARTFRKDLTTVVWQGTEVDRPFPYGAVARCGTDAVLVEGSLAFPARLKLTQMTPPKAGTFSKFVLAGGKRYDDETAARAAKAILGQLTAVSVHQDLTGKGHPVAVLGSSDGWLYEIQPCTGELIYAYNFGAPVGESVFGDTDGDGKDEIIVSSADGYLYGMKDAVLEAPKDVIDIPVGGGTVDIDETTNVTAVAGRWSKVTGVDQYEVAVVDSKGAFVTSPSWISVGNVDTAMVDKLSLAVGERYVFAVRAKGAAGYSPDGYSDGVTVVSEAADAGPDSAVTDAGPDADAGSVATDVEGGGGCGCRVGGAERTAHHTLELLLGCSLLLARRASRRRASVR